MATPEKRLFGKIAYQLIIKGVWSVTLIGTVAVFILFAYVANTKMPDTKELENPRFDESSIVYADGGEELDRFFRNNRQWIKYDDISPNLVNALIATEDHRFYHHSGIDARGLARAIAYLGSKGGASTITQQLAKQFYTERRSSFFPKRVWQKMKEWVIAIEFERRYTKEELIAMFLNKFDFLNQANGIASAANIYFGKDQSELSVVEAAVLIGMLKSPTLYNPLQDSTRPITRRNWVLSQMNKYGYLDQKEYNILRVEPTDISKFSRGENYSGLAPHFMSILKQQLKNILRDNNITKPGGATYNIDTDGLKIYTTIDYTYQKHAVAAAREHMKVQQERFFRTWRDKDPWTYIDNKKGLTKNEIKNQLVIRNNKLSYLIESSRRYKNLRYHYLDDIINDIRNDIPEARLYAGDIRRMLRAENNRSYLDKQVGNKVFSERQKEVYIQILESVYWDRLKKQWTLLQERSQKDFDRVIPMSIYSYDGHIEVEMSPIDSIKYMESFLQLGSISMDPQSGYIKSWVGGSDYHMWKYDHVTSRRQVGSTFKPFLYTTALNNALSPCIKVRDVQHTVPAGRDFALDESWSPKNTRGTFTGEEYTLKEGLKQSLNSVSVWLLNEIGSVRPIVQLAERMGISKNRIPEVPSIILGSPELSVLEMTQAYSTYANDGMSPTPMFIKKIEHKGVVLYEENSSSHRSINKHVNYAMVQLLKHASSAVSSQLKSEFGGKTGTTNDHVDGWFMGISPRLVTGTWVGGAYNWIRFLSIEEGQGGRMSRPFFIDFMRRLESDDSIDMNTEERFLVPDEIAIITDCDAYNNIVEDRLEDELEDL